MAIYLDYKFEFGATFTSMANFTNASTGTIIVRNNGERYIKNSKGVWEVADSATYLDIEKLTVGNSNGESASTAGAGTVKYLSGKLYYSNGSSWIDLSSSGIGFNQTWQDVTSSRASNVTYTNTTSKPIMVMVSTGNGNYGFNQVYVNGLLIEWVVDGDFSGGTSITFIVPPGATYKVIYIAAWVWAELR